MAEIVEKEINVAGADVTLTTTTETAIISLSGVPAPMPTARVVIKAWALLTTGAGTTSVTPRIRRGTDTSGAVVGEANTETVKVAAGSTEPFFKMASEERVGGGTVAYVLTLAQVGATANGTVLEAGIEVEVLGG